MTPTLKPCISCDRISSSCLYLRRSPWPVQFEHPCRESTRKLLLSIQQLAIVIHSFLFPSEQFLLLVRTLALAETDKISVCIADLDTFSWNPITPLTHHHPPFTYEQPCLFDTKEATLSTLMQAPYKGQTLSLIGHYNNHQTGCMSLCLSLWWDPPESYRKN